MACRADVAEIPARGRDERARAGKGTQHILDLLPGQLVDPVANLEPARLRIPVVDVEGAELRLLKGATAVLAQPVPPVIIMEMAMGTSSVFGYVPNDLIEFIRSKADFNFYKIDEINGKLIEITGFAPDDIGANVICVPA